MDTVDTHLGKLEELVDDIEKRTFVEDGSNVIKSKMVKATYHSTAILKLLADESNEYIKRLETVMNDANANIGKLETVMQSANENIRSLEAVMLKVKKIVDKSDRKARNIFWATIITLIVAIITLLETIEIFREDNPNKKNLIEINKKMEEHLYNMENLLKGQQDQSSKEKVLIQRVDSLLDGEQMNIANQAKQRKSDKTK